jgi:hypothetical protein
LHVFNIFNIKIFYLFHTITAIWISESSVDLKITTGEGSISILTVLQQNKHNHKKSCVLNLSFIQNNLYSHLMNTVCDIELNGGLVSGWHLFHISSFFIIYRLSCFHSKIRNINRAACSETDNEIEERKQTIVCLSLFYTIVTSHSNVVLFFSYCR